MEDRTFAALHGLEKFPDQLAVAPVGVLNASSRLPHRVWLAASTKR